MAVNNKVIRKFKPKMAAGPRPAAIPLASAPAAAPSPLPPPAREIPSAMPISLPIPHSAPPAPVAPDIESTIAAPAALAAPPIPGQRIHRLQSAIQKEKTGIILDGGSGIKGLAEAAEKAVQAKIEEFRDQMQNYLEVCDSLASDTWEPQDLIDVLHMLVLSLGMDVVSMVLMDPRQPGRLAEAVVSRGYRTPPGVEVRACWQGAVGLEGRGIQWQRLMEISADNENALSSWLAQEDLHSYGYVPIRDNHRIHGFLLIGAHGGKEPSPLASGLLEVAGGRIGLSLAVRPDFASARHEGMAAEAAPPELKGAIQELRSQLTRATGCVGMLREGVGTDISPDECRDLVEQCATALAESTRLLRRLAVPGVN